MEIADVFDNIGTALGSFMNNLTEGIGTVFSLFYDSTNQAFTPMGILTLIGLGVGLAWTAFRLVRGAIRGVTKSN